MRTRVVRRALAAGLSLTIAAAGFAAADSLRVQGDVIIPGNTVDLGSAAPGATVTGSATLSLVCANSTHATPGSTISVTQGATDVPTGGSLTLTPTTIPVPTTWPAAGVPCPSSGLTAPAAEPLGLTVVAPTTPGSYAFVALLVADPSTGIAGTPSVTATLTVIGNSPPSLHLPGDFTAEGNVTGGWVAEYSVAATDPEDDPDPAVSCAPSQGSVLSLGATTVTCSATDTGGQTASGSFTVTVFDTTPPTLSGIPEDISVEATSDVGAVVTWPAPTAVDAVDAAASVDCQPASGSTFGVGTTTVTCTARDATGNAAAGTFQVSVTRLPSVAVTWGEPIGGAASLAANRGRTLPLRAAVSVDGSAVAATTAVRVALERLDACGGASVEQRSGPVMTWDGGRRAANLDTSTLPAGCWRVGVEADGVRGGWFELRLVEGAVGTTTEGATRTPRASR